MQFIWYQQKPLPVCFPGQLKVFIRHDDFLPGSIHWNMAELSNAVACVQFDPFYSFSRAVKNRRFLELPTIKAGNPNDLRFSFRNLYSKFNTPILTTSLSEVTLQLMTLRRCAGFPKLVNNSALMVMGPPSVCLLSP